MFSSLASISPTRSDWQVRVRVTRTWPSLSRCGVFQGFNIIIRDADVQFNIVFRNKYEVYSV